MRNQRKLEYLLATIKIAHLTFDNKQQIASLLTQLEKSTRKKEKASQHYELGVLYTQMKDIDNGILHFGNAVNLLPTHSGYLTALIHEELKAGRTRDAFNHSRQLLESDIKNPAVPDRIIQIFMTHNKAQEVEDFFQEMVSVQTDSEALGNLYFNLGNFQLMTGKSVEGLKNMASAKKNFQRVLPPDHPVFIELAKLKLP